MGGGGGSVSRARGIAAVVRATGISESTVARGLADLDSGEVLEAGRVRRAGAGQVPILEREPGLWEALEGLVDPVTRGDPMSPLRWTSKSGAKLAAALREKGHDVVDRTVLRLLKANGYSLQATRRPGRARRIPIVTRSLSTSTGRWPSRSRRVSR